MTWDVPTAEDCPYCGQSLYKKSGRGNQKSFCINPDCENFLPEDQRGYRRKPAAEQPVAEAGETLPAEPAAAAPAEEPKKTAAKSAAAKKSTTAKKTTAAKKTTTAKKTTATKKPAARKTAAKKKPEDEA